MAKLKIHTVDQPETDITTFVLSCDRLDVLDRTIQSFNETKEYVTKMVIVDDSATPGVFQSLVDKYGYYCDVICFPKNRSQWWAMDFMVSYCDTDYIFYLEDDWQFLKSGYMQKSKDILVKYRNIGVIDISLRTFEEQGIDSYHKEVIDGFHYKKAWKITDYHLHWYGWVGSPNLKRRDDLILLGRVEKWHNEWNIDRKFLGLGFKSVFLEDRYVVHLGDHCSKMDGQRPDDGTTPEHYYPAELRADRTMPKFDYMSLDTNWRSPTDITLVTMMVNLGRDDRDFEDHYFNSLTSVLNSRHPIVMYTEEKYFDRVREIRGNRPLSLIKFDNSDIEQFVYHADIQNIITDDTWLNQSAWLKDSVIRTPNYIPLTLLKNSLLTDASATNAYNSSYYYWIDSGICSSFNIHEPLDQYFLTKIPKYRFFITSFPYATNSEIHGYNINKLIEHCGTYLNYVCRATLFGGTPEQIREINRLFYTEVERAIANGAIGTEEAIYTILSIQYPHLFDRFKMETGDINHFLNVLR